MTTRKVKDDLDFALDLTSTVQHVATALGKAEGALSVDDLAAGYVHGNTGDLARVRTHQNLGTDAEAVIWLIQRAVSELTRIGKRGKIQLKVEEGWVSLAPDVVAEDLKWRGHKVYVPTDIHSVLGDPFNPMSGRFASNVRKNTGKDDLSGLKESMRVAGWLPDHPAVKDARTKVTISGHRRLQAAAELRAEGVEIEDNISYRNFELAGEGDPADVHRLDEAYFSNWEPKSLTPEERAEAALWMAEQRGMSQQQIAKVLGKSQQQISRDMRQQLTQMSNAGELEPQIAIATAGIQRGESQRQVGIELGLPDNSMVLAKVYAIATDRLRREFGLPAAEPETTTEPQPGSGSTADKVHEAIREGEEEIASGNPMTTLEDVVPEDPTALGDSGTSSSSPESASDAVAGSFPEDPVNGLDGGTYPGYEHSTGDSDGDGYDQRPEPKWPLTEPRPAVQPPANLPKAPVRREDDDRYPAHDLAWHQLRAEQLARQLDPLNEYPEAVQQLRDAMEACWDDAIKSWQVQTTPYGT